MANLEKEAAKLAAEFDSMQASAVKLYAEKQENDRLAAIAAEFEMPAPWQQKSSRARGASNSAPRGKRGSGKRAAIKAAMLDAPADYFSGTAWDQSLASEHDSSLSSVRSIKADLLCCAGSIKPYLAPSFAAIVREAKPGSGLAALNRALWADRAITTDAMVAHLRGLGFSGFTIDRPNVGASISASLESFDLLEAAGLLRGADLLDFAGKAA